MTQELMNIPNTMVGFKVSNETTQDDFDSIMLPSIVELLKRTDRLNYLLVVEEPIQDFEIGAWTKDALINLNHFESWHRTAIVSKEREMDERFETFRKDIPGELKHFEYNEMDQAIEWVGDPNEKFMERALEENRD